MRPVEIARLAEIERAAEMRVPQGEIASPVQLVQPARVTRIPLASRDLRATGPLALPETARDETHPIMPPETAMEALAIAPATGPIVVET
jgi:hypothetical protein